ncbi:retinol dehydrogenase 14-like [Pectinophora gossypiella]|uniref:retinol dehydrogenase 14-like n=1 Tax=Pectinophora gossypiella TaxID=13191 RepID=UPI00214E598E|nr:retinol dehydrogenase 14-like [Pectinophora gossypiella]
MWIFVTIFWILVTLLLIKISNRLSTGKCYADTVMSGKVVIVTGANSGIGYATSMELARRGAKVILACRDDSKGYAAEKSIRKITKNPSVRYQHLDLSSFASIRKFVEDFKNAEAKLDVLINNAGASGMGSWKTKDGVIRDMQVNHFGPFLLTLLLVPILKKSAPSRVINMSSFLHKFGTINKINEEGVYGYLRTFCNSKLCNVLFSNELARRLEGTGVVVNSLNPGQVNTSLYKATIIEKLRCLVLYTFFKSPAEGAQTSIYLAVSDECDQVSGRYFEDCAERDMSWKAEDRDLCEKLWGISEELVGLRQDERV